MRTPAAPAGHALVLAPFGRDAAVATSLLTEAGIACLTCQHLEALHEALGSEAHFVVVAEEVLRGADLRGVAAWIDAQPAWSDLPFIVLTQRGGGVERNPAAARLSEVLGHVSFLERPFHPTTFLSVTRSALRNRLRQYEARDLNDTLEQRVAARSAELEQAHRALLQHIEQRERTEEQLRQAQKMEMVGQLTGGVAHDFNNLLMVVLVNLELLRMQVPPSEMITRLIDGAVKSARRGSVLTQRLLAFARRQELHIQGHDLAALLRGMRDLLDRSLGSTFQVQMQFAEPLPPALLDANQVELAVLNLAINARDAMPDGGQITIAVDSAVPPAELALAAGEYLRISVQDAGCGMDEETLRRATEPFFSTKEVGKGTGLGLSMIHGLAVQLHGSLRLESEPGKGTRAELWLPVAREITAPPVAAEVAPLPATPPLKVLLVDDDELVAEGTTGMLRALGHDVVRASSGAAALATLDDGADVDLMITDYAMPHMTGVQLAQTVRERCPGLPILLATGYAEYPAESALALPRLNKPYEQAALDAEIRRLVHP